MVYHILSLFPFRYQAQPLQIDVQMSCNDKPSDESGICYLPANGKCVKEMLLNPDQTRDQYISELQ